VRVLLQDLLDAEGLAATLLAIGSGFCPNVCQQVCVAPPLLLCAEVSPAREWSKRDVIDRGECTWFWVLAAATGAPLRGSVEPCPL